MFLEVQGIEKEYRGERVLDGVSFGLEKEKTLAILGRSGSGKTTLLKILAGIEEAEEGGISLDGRRIEQTPARERGIVYLYQEPLLFPHLDVQENVAFGLRLRGEKGGQLARKVEAMLESLGLGGQGKKAPHQLSGGQRQRVSFGRALIVNPRLLLLDEPFGNLDFETRASMQALFKEVAKEYRITSLFVTHDLKEAILMGDRLAHLRGGHLRLYQDRAEALADPNLGVAQEVRFWRSVAEATEGTP